MLTWSRKPLIVKALLFSYVVHYAWGALTATPIVSLIHTLPKPLPASAIGGAFLGSPLFHEGIRFYSALLSNLGQLCAILLLVGVGFSVVPLTGLIVAIEMPGAASRQTWLRRTLAALPRQAALSLWGVGLSLVLGVGGWALGWRLGVTLALLLAPPLHQILGLGFAALGLLPCVGLQIILGLSRFAKDARAAGRLLTALQFWNQHPYRVSGSYALIHALAGGWVLLAECTARAAGAGSVASLLAHALGLFGLECCRAEWLSRAQRLLSSPKLKA